MPTRSVARRAAGGPLKAKSAADAGPAARYAGRLDLKRLNSATVQKTPCVVAEAYWSVSGHVVLTCNSEPEQLRMG